MKGELKLAIKTNMGQIANEVMRKGVYDIFVDELLNTTAEFETESYRGATLDLASSWNLTRPKKEAVTFTIKASITNTSEQAIRRITGRSAGKRPPIEPLTDWVMAKGIANVEKKARSIAFAIALSIAKKGTERHRTKENFAGLNPDGSFQPGGKLHLAEQMIAQKLRNLS